VLHLAAAPLFLPKSVKYKEKAKQFLPFTIKALNQNE
jgi:hypothetical protein